MVNGITWEEETMARIKEARQKQEASQNIIKQAQIEENQWKAVADTLEKALQLYKKQHSLYSDRNQALDYERLRTQSTWDSLVEIMAANQGLLVVVDAVTTLIEAKVFSEREHARNVIYSTLYSHKKDIKRVRRGIYRLRTDSEKSRKTTVGKHRKVSGLRLAVKNLKEKFPQFDKEQAVNHLIVSGFDFKGSNPKKAVNIVWANLGYAKEGKQRLFPQLT